MASLPAFAVPNVGMGFIFALLGVLGVTLNLITGNGSFRIPRYEQKEENGVQLCKVTKDFNLSNTVMSSSALAYGGAHVSQSLLNHRFAAGVMLALITWLLISTIFTIYAQATFDKPQDMLLKCPLFEDAGRFNETVSNKFQVHPVTVGIFNATEDLYEMAGNERTNVASCLTRQMGKYLKFAPAEPPKHNLHLESYAAGSLRPSEVERTVKSVDRKNVSANSQQRDSFATMCTKNSGVFTTDPADGSFSSQATTDMECESNRWNAGFVNPAFEVTNGNFEGKMLQQSNVWETFKSEEYWETGTWPGSGSVWYQPNCASWGESCGISDKCCPGLQCIDSQCSKDPTFVYNSAKYVDTPNYEVARRDTEMVLIPHNFPDSATPPARPMATLGQWIFQLVGVRMDRNIVRPTNSEVFQSGNQVCSDRPDDAQNLCFDCSIPESFVGEYGSTEDTSGFYDYRLYEYCWMQRNLQDVYDDETDRPQNFEAHMVRRSNSRRNHPDFTGALSKFADGKFLIPHDPNARVEFAIKYPKNPDAPEGSNQCEKDHGIEDSHCLGPTQAIQSDNTRRDCQSYTYHSDATHPYLNYFMDVNCSVAQLPLCPWASVDQTLSLRNKDTSSAPELREVPLPKYLHCDPDQEFCFPSLLNQPNCVTMSIKTLVKGDDAEDPDKGPHAANCEVFSSEQLRTLHVKSAQRFNNECSKNGRGPLYQPEQCFEYPGDSSDFGQIGECPDSQDCGEYGALSGEGMSRVTGWNPGAGTYQSLFSGAYQGPVQTSDSFVSLWSTVPRDQLQHALFRVKRPGQKKLANDSTISNDMTPNLNSQLQSVDISLHLDSEVSLQSQTEDMPNNIGDMEFQKIITKDCLEFFEQCFDESSIDTCNGCLFNKLHTNNAWVQHCFQSDWLGSFSHYPSWSHGKYSQLSHQSHKHNKFLDRSERSDRERFPFIGEEAAAARAKEMSLNFFTNMPVFTKYTSGPNSQTVQESVQDKHRWCSLIKSEQKTFDDNDKQCKKSDSKFSQKYVYDLPAAADEQVQNFCNNMPCCQWNNGQCEASDAGQCATDTLFDPSKLNYPNSEFPYNVSYTGSKHNTGIDSDPHDITYFATHSERPTLNALNQDGEEDGFGIPGCEQQRLVDGVEITVVTPRVRPHPALQEVNEQFCMGLAYNQSTNECTGCLDDLTTRVTDENLNQLGQGWQMSSEPAYVPPREILRYGKFLSVLSSKCTQSMFDLNPAADQELPDTTADNSTFADCILKFGLVTDSDVDITVPPKLAGAWYDKDAEAANRSWPSSNILHQDLDLTQSNKAGRDTNLMMFGSTTQADSGFFQRDYAQLMAHEYSSKYPHKFAVAQCDLYAGVAASNAALTYTPAAPSLESTGCYMDMGEKQPWKDLNYSQAFTYPQNNGCEFEEGADAYELSVLNKGDAKFKPGRCAKGGRAGLFYETLQDSVPLMSHAVSSFLQPESTADDSTFFIPNQIVHTNDLQLVPSEYGPGGGFPDSNYITTFGMWNSICAHEKTCPEMRPGFQAGRMARQTEYCVLNQKAHLFAESDGIPSDRTRVAERLNGLGKLLTGFPFGGMYAANFGDAEEFFENQKDDVCHTAEGCDPISATVTQNPSDFLSIVNTDSPQSWVKDSLHKLNVVGRTTAVTPSCKFKRKADFSQGCFEANTKQVTYHNFEEAISDAAIRHTCAASSVNVSNDTIQDSHLCFFRRRNYHNPHVLAAKSYAGTFDSTIAQKSYARAHNRAIKSETLKFNQEGPFLDFNSFLFDYTGWEPHENKKITFDATYDSQEILFTPARNQSFTRWASIPNQTKSSSLGGSDKIQVYGMTTTFFPDDYCPIGAFSTSNRRPPKATLDNVSWTFVPMYEDKTKFMIGGNMMLNPFSPWWGNDAVRNPYIPPGKATELESLKGPYFASDTPLSRLCEASSPGNEDSLEFSDVRFNRTVKTTGAAFMDTTGWTDPPVSSSSASGWTDGKYYHQQSEKYSELMFCATSTNQARFYSETPAEDSYTSTTIIDGEQVEQQEEEARIERVRFGNEHRIRTGGAWPAFDENSKYQFQNESLDNQESLKQRFEAGQQSTVLQCNSPPCKPITSETFRRNNTTYLERDARGLPVLTKPQDDFNLESIYTIFASLPGATPKAPFSDSDSLPSKYGKLLPFSKCAKQTTVNRNLYAWMGHSYQDNSPTLNTLSSHSVSEPHFEPMRAMSELYFLCNERYNPGSTSGGLHTSNLWVEYDSKDGSSYQAETPATVFAYVMLVAIIAQLLLFSKNNLLQ